MKTSLYFCQGPSDKVYHVQMEKLADGYVVNFQYGRRGSSLTVGTKTNFAVSQDAAQKIYDKLVKEKLAKGYDYIKGEASGPSVTPVFTKKESLSNMLPQLLNAIEDPEVYITDDRFIAQEKMDGERRMVSLMGETITQTNRKGESIPTVMDLKSALGYECTVYSENIGDEYFVFDLLSFKGKDLRSLPYSERYSILNSVSFGKGINIVPLARGTKEKRKLYERLKKENKEGIVFKREDAPYSIGRPSSGGDQLKFKFYKTATFIVASVTKGKRSVGLELFDKGERVFMGKVTISPNFKVPSIGELVEVRYLYCFKQGCVYQPTFLGPRTDIDLKDATINQIVYKAVMGDE